MVTQMLSLELLSFEKVLKRSRTKFGSCRTLGPSSSFRVSHVQLRACSISDTRSFTLHSGAIPSPFDCYLILRGIKTLAVRSLKHGLNALAIAKILASHPLVEEVIYPGLQSHRSYKFAKEALGKQVKKELAQRSWNESKEGGVPFSGMVSFTIKKSSPNSSGGEEGLSPAIYVLHSKSAQLIILIG